ncbi:MAG: type II toxin-antitoxin system VapC family toxin [Balneolia bacterium]|nr:type II toxin-antitoxin system VapC family toxin [Balneolia bacterium]
MVLLDTHIWLWWLLGDGALSDKQRSALGKLAASRQLAVSWVSVWETEMLEMKQRVQLRPNLAEWIEAAVHPDVCLLLPVDTHVVLAQRRLPDSFHGDPADRLIAASALLGNMKLATADTKIIDSGVIDIWKA